MKSGKGLRDSIRRACVLPARYGFRAERIQTRLKHMLAFLERWEVTPTIPITANVLDRHSHLVDDLRRADPAIHGYRHIRYSRLTPTRQAEDLDRAVGAFRRHDLPARGFRAPYLAVDQHTRGLLATREFDYDSSACTLSLPRDHPATPSVLRLAETRYGAISDEPAAPSMNELPLELPVALPDDEILVDGLGIHNSEELARIFRAMTENCLRSAGLLVLQIHPERFHLCSTALEDVLRFATDEGAWIAPLTEIAEHLRSGVGRWRRGGPMAMAITGDLDAASLFDFAFRPLEG